jgi:predicted type IV restriction endonuclease
LTWSGGRPGASFGCLGILSVEVVTIGASDADRDSVVRSMAGVAAMDEAAMTRWEERARARLADALPRIKRHARVLRDANANEATTRSVVSEMLSDAFGYDSAAEVDQEAGIREERADYGLKARGKMVALVEVKRIGVSLHQRHLNQLEGYALRRGIRWAILTNGQVWRLYHIDGGTPTSTTLVQPVDLLDGSRTATHVPLLLMMSKEALQRDWPIAKWREEHAKSAETLRRALMSDAVIRAMSTAIHKEARYRATPVEIREALSEQLLRPGIA